MADTDWGGCARRAVTGWATTRPSAWSRETTSGPSGAKAERIRSVASSTESITRSPSWGLEGTGLAAALMGEPDLGDAHGLIDRLHHVVDGERRHRDGGQRLHLDAGAAFELAGGLDYDRGLSRVDRELDLDRGERQRMAKRNKVGRLLGTHDAGELRYGKHIAFLD